MPAPAPNADRFDADTALLCPSTSVLSPRSVLLSNKEAWSNFCKVLRKLPGTVGSLYYALGSSQEVVVEPMDDQADDVSGS